MKNRININKYLIKKRLGEIRLPLSFYQESLWRLDQISNNACVNNVDFTLYVEGKMIIANLRYAFEEVVKRHDILRTNFLYDKDGCYQVISDFTYPGINIINTTGLSNISEEIPELLKQLANQPFDLATDIKVRLSIIVLSCEKYLINIAIHHLVIDAESMEIFKNELLENYQNLCNSIPINKSILKLQYADYCYFQRTISKSKIEKQKNYWIKQLKSPPRLSFPLIESNKKITPFECKHQHFLIKSELKNNLTDFSIKHNVSLFMTLLAVLKLLIQRYSQENEIRIAVPVTKRPSEITNELIGFFVNTIIIKSCCLQSMSFEEFLNQVKQSTLMAFENSDYPISDITREVDREASKNKYSLYQILFSYININSKAASILDLNISEYLYKTDYSEFDLRVFITEPEDKLSVSFAYRCDVFDDQTISSMTSDYEYLLSIVTSIKSIKLSAIWNKQHFISNLLTSGSIGEHTGISKGNNLIDYFNNQVKINPHAIAIEHFNTNLSYYELDISALRLATSMYSNGVNVQDIIAIYLDRGIDLYIAIIAVLKVGAIFLLINPKQPIERVRYMLLDTQLETAITTTEYDDEIKSLGVKNIFNIKLDSSHILPHDNFNILSTDNALAYIVYTSGSTKKPKGVMANHRSAINRINWLWKEFPFYNSDICCHKSPVSFIDSIYEILSPLLFGIKAVILDDEIVHDVKRFIKHLNQKNITRLTVVPSYLDLINQYTENINNSSLKLCVSSGESLHRNTAIRFKDKYPQTILLNFYGASEVAADVCYSVYKKCDSNIKIGKAIENTNLLILDENLNFVPYGVQGDVYVSGMSLSHGYLNAAAHTALTFIPNPHSKNFGDRMYYTGDKAWLNRQGDIILSSRNTDIVKIRGQRVSLTEVKNTLLNYLHIEDCIVLMDQSGSDSDSTMIAFVCNGDLTKLKKDEIYDYLKTYLLSYMLPKEIVFLERLPLNQSGKVDRLALQDYKIYEKNTSEFKVAKKKVETETEKKIEDIWCHHLNIKNIDLDENFFTVGGHSLLAIQVVLFINEMFHIRIPVKSIYEYSTVSTFSNMVDRELDTRGITTVSGLAKFVICSSEKYEPFPLTDVQYAYWIGRNKAFNTGNISTHAYLEIDYQGLDIQRFENALNALISRHDMLRVVVESDGRQRVLKSVNPYTVEVKDISAYNVQVQKQRLEETRYLVSHEIIELSRWPLFNIIATCINAKLIRIHVSFDLIIADAKSFRTLIADLQEYYRNLDVQLSPIDICFRDYVLWERSLNESTAFIEAQNYWRERIDSLPLAPSLPKKPVLKDSLNYRFVRNHHRLTEKEWFTLKEIAISNKISVSSILISAFAKILFKWCRDKSFTINITLFNRYPVHKDINQLVGDFTSTLLLQVDNICSFDNFGVFAAQVHQQLWNDLNNSLYSGIKVLRDLASYNGDGNIVPMPIVFTSALNLDDKLGESVIASGEEFNIDLNRKLNGEVIYSIGQTSQIWLDHQVFEQDGELIFNWDYVKEIFPDNMIDDMFSNYVKFLKWLSIPGNYSSNKEINLLPDLHKNIYLKLNNTEYYPLKDLLHSKFIIHAGKHPKNIAVISRGKTLTYGQLFNHAVELAKKLDCYNCNHLVAVIVEKGWEQIAAVMGILFSGAAYIPVDVNLPKKRIAAILSDAGVSVAVISNAPEIQDLIPNDVHAVVFEQNSKLNNKPCFYCEKQKPSDIAYVIYTSGTTGKPKGVVIKHQSVVNTIDDINIKYAVNDIDKVLCLSSLEFDLSVYDIFGLLSVGGCLVIPTQDQTREPHAWLDLIYEYDVTIWNSVPAFMKMLVDYKHLWAMTDDKHHQLRLCLLSGDWIPVELPEKIRHIFNNIQIVSLGGATEVSIWSIYHDILGSYDDYPSIPYGKPLRNQEVYVLDKQMEMCPFWVVGEIYIGGMGLAEGYWKDDERTKSSFVYNQKTQQRLYKTGDFGKYHPDGNIEFLGREDMQVKVNGYRVEITEIENTLSEHSNINGVLIELRYDDNASPHLVAFYKLVDHSTNISHSGIENVQEVKWEEIFKNYLIELLPSYMIPDIYQEITDFPLSSNGKVDRNLLPELCWGDLQDGSNDYLPVTSLQSALQKIWCQLLGKESISINDNFFRLGGNSLMAATLTGTIENVVGKRIPLVELYNSPTITGIADYIEHKVKSADVNCLPTVEIDKQNRYMPFCLTDIQEAYWVGRQGGFLLGDVSTHFYSEITFTDFNIHRFNKAINSLINRHDMLRIVIQPDAKQRILENVNEYQVAYNDLESHSDEDKETLLIKIRDEMSHQKLNIEEWPLFDIRASRLNSTNTLIHLSVDLLMMDASSHLILLNDFKNIYNGKTLQPLQLNFRDYVVAYQKIKNTDLYRSSKEYWKNIIKTLPPAPKLPLVLDQNEVNSMLFKRRHSIIPANLWQRLKRSAAEYDVTASSLLLTCFSLVLNRWINEDKFTLNLTVFNRLNMHKQVNNIVGDFTSTSLFVVEFDSVSNFTETIQRMQKKLWENLDNKYFSGIEVIRELYKINYNIEETYMPVVFTSMVDLNIGSMPDNPSEQDEKDIHAQEQQDIGTGVFGISQTSQVWLDLQVSESNGNLSIVCDAVEELFSAEFLDQMFDEYKTLLDRLLEEEEWSFLQNIDQLFFPKNPCSRSNPNNYDTASSDE